MMIPHRHVVVMLLLQYTNHLLFKYFQTTVFRRRNTITGQDFRYVAAFHILYLNGQSTESL